MLMRVYASDQELMGPRARKRFGKFQAIANGLVGSWASYEARRQGEFSTEHPLHYLNVTYGKPYVLPCHAHVSVVCGGLHSHATLGAGGLQAACRPHATPPDSRGAGAPARAAVEEWAVESLCRGAPLPRRRRAGPARGRVGGPLAHRPLRRLHQVRRAPAGVCTRCRLPVWRDRALSTRCGAMPVWPSLSTRGVVTPRRYPDFWPEMEDTVERAMMWIPNQTLMDTATAALPPPLDFALDPQLIQTRQWKSGVRTPRPRLVPRASCLVPRASCLLVVIDVSCSTCMTGVRRCCRRAASGGGAHCEEGL
jgi:hypothetical protein